MIFGRRKRTRLLEIGPRGNRDLSLIVALAALLYLASLAALLLRPFSGLDRDILPGGTGTLPHDGGTPRFVEFFLQNGAGNE